MTDIWFTSDTHFFHGNILKFVGDDGQRIRAPFQSIEEMHAAMIERWNARVKPQDKVYHLGDVTFRYDGPFNELMHRLNGHKRLNIGNHDKLNASLLQHFEKAELWTTRFKTHGFITSHLPLREDGFRADFNVHGHIHQNQPPTKRHINVSVEVRGYAPVHLDEIKQEISRLRDEIHRNGDMGRCPASK